MEPISADEFGSIFTQSLIDVISKTTGFSLDILSTAPDTDFNEIVALMYLNSNKGGMIFISAGEPTLCTLCSYMEGDSRDKITTVDIEDVLCELVNMTAGNAKLQLSNIGYLFKLSSPFIISGKNLSIRTKKRVNIVSRTIGNGEITVKLKIIY